MGKEENGSRDRGRCVTKNLLLITHVTNKRAVITANSTCNTARRRSERLLQWRLSLYCLSSWSWSACSLHNIRQVSLSFI